MKRKVSPKKLPKIQNNKKQKINENKEETKMCRICYEETGKLIKPCNCKGSIGFVHKECLSRTRTIQKYRDINYNMCNMCHSNYNCVFKEFQLVEITYIGWNVVRYETFNIYSVYCEFMYKNTQYSLKYYTHPKYINPSNNSSSYCILTNCNTEIGMDYNYMIDDEMYFGIPIEIITYVLEVMKKHYGPSIYFYKNGNETGCYSMGGTLCSHNCKFCNNYENWIWTTFDSLKECSNFFMYKSCEEASDAWNRFDST